MILPHVEETAVYSLINVSKTDLATSMDTPANLTAMQAPVTVYRCPSDTARAMNDERLITSTAGTANELATSNYVGVNSSSELRRDQGPPGNFANGIFVINKGTKISEITDGTSHTAILGERAWESKVSAAVATPGTGDGIVRSRGGVVFGVRGVRHKSEQGLADGMDCGKFQVELFKLLRKYSGIRRPAKHFPARTTAVRISLSPMVASNLSPTRLRAISTQINGRSRTPSTVRGGAVGD